MLPNLLRIGAGAGTQGPAYHGEIRGGGVLVGDSFEEVSRLSAQVFAAGRDRSRPNLKIQDGCNNRCASALFPPFGEAAAALRRKAWFRAFGGWLDATRKWF